MKLDIIYNPSENEIEPIERGLHEFNRARLGDDILNNFHRLLVLARDESSAVTGGAYGLVIWQWLHLQTLWVAASHRHQGLGSQILSILENEAIAKGARGSHLETTDFQALGFYLKNDYQVFGELEDKPLGHTWYYLKKKFV